MKIQIKKLIGSYQEWDICYKLIPFLLLYLTICIKFSQHSLFGDEGTYIGFASNLLNGFYSPPAPNINLWAGPGYPALLAPFLSFKPSLIVLRLLNVLLLYSSLVISYKTFNIYSPRKSSFFYTILLGLYFPIYEMLPLIFTEILAWFLISLICFLFIKSYKKEPISWKWILPTAFTIAYLVMTKVGFGFVILSMFFVSIFLFLSSKCRSWAKRSTLIFLLAFIFCLPYLLYTYSLTNKPFYWTNAGGMSLYTMSTPYANELGDWSTSDRLLNNPNHAVFIESISKLTPLERDEAYKSAAIENIKSNPKKYFSNYIANIGRLLFSFPFSDTKQTTKTYFTLIPNMFLIVLVVLTLPACILSYKKIPKELILLFIFIFIYLFGSTFLSAYRRMFYITIPFWFLYISYVFNNIITVKIKYNEKDAISS